MAELFLHHETVDVRPTAQPWSHEEYVRSLQLATWINTLEEERRQWHEKMYREGHDETGGIN